MARGMLPKVLLLALLSAVLFSVACADVVPDTDDAEVEVDDLSDDTPMEEFTTSRVPYFCRAIFPNCSSPLFIHLPAGSKADSLIAYHNNGESHNHTVILVIAYIQPHHNYLQVIQNFSAVRQARVVAPGQTSNFQYTFTPDANLEPGDYNLVMGMYYVDAEDNQTKFAVAYNATVNVEESLDTDPRTILTYLTLVAMFSGAAYILADRFGLIKMIQNKRKSNKKAAAKVENWVEVGTQGNGYDLSYISEEHRRIREAVMSPNLNRRHSPHLLNKKR